MGCENQNKYKDFVSVCFASLSLLIAIFSIIISVKSCSIAEDQANRYYREIIFIASCDPDNNLNIRQVSGSLYYLNKVTLIPFYVCNNKSPIRKGYPYVLELGGTYQGKEKGYFIQNINKHICLVQKIEDCEKQQILNLRMEYKVGEVTKTYDIK